MKHQVGCGLHPWETSFVRVMPHPFFAVTAGLGSYQFDNVPHTADGRGRVTLAAWHEQLGEIRWRVRHLDDRRRTVAFIFKSPEDWNATTRDVVYPNGFILEMIAGGELTVSAVDKGSIWSRIMPGQATFLVQGGVIITLPGRQRFDLATGKLIN